MTEESKQNSQTSESGLLGQLASFGANTSEHIRLRFQLLGAEGKEAGLHYLRFGIWLAAGLTFLLFAYLLIVIGVIFAIAESTEVSWIWIALATGGIHLLLTLICMLVCKNMLKRPMMQASLEELKKDSEWLKKHQK